MRLIARFAPPLAALSLAMLTHAPGARAADLHITLPTLTAGPGSTLVIPLDVTPGPSGLEIVSMDFVMPLDPAVIASSSLVPEGFLAFWGPPFVNATGSLVAGASAGLTAVTSATSRMCTVLITVKGTATPGSIMPLTFSSLRFNEGAPSSDFTPGSITVSNGVDVPMGQPAGTRLLAPRPNPARGELRAEFALARSGAARLTLHDLQGRLVRVLAQGSFAAGQHESNWDGRDERGRPVAPGLLLLRLHTDTATLLRRVVWVR